MAETWKNYIAPVVIATLIISSIGFIAEKVYSEKNKNLTIETYLDLCLQQKNKTGIGVGFSVYNYDINENCILTKLSQ